MSGSSGRAKITPAERRGTTTSPPLVTTGQRGADARVVGPAGKFLHKFAAGFSSESAGSRAGNHVAATAQLQ
jgi:hypothetical protein